MVHPHSPMGVNFKEALVTLGPNSLHMVNTTTRKKKQVAEQGALRFLKANTVGVFKLNIFHENATTCIIFLIK